MENNVELEKEIEEKIRIYRKNQQALFETAALAYELPKEESMPITLSTLIYKFIENLQDDEIKISYKGKSFVYQYEDMIKSINKMKDYYCQQDSKMSTKFQEIRSRRFDSYLFDSAIYINPKEGNIVLGREYNIINLLIKNREIYWLKEILTSKDIPTKVRCNMIDDIISVKDFSLKKLLSEDSYNYPDSVYPEIFSFYDTNERKKDCNETIIELLKVWSKNSQIETDEKYFLIRNYPIDNVILLQEYGIIDFTDLIYIDEDYSRKLALPAQVYLKTNKIDKIKPFYEADSYNTVSSTIRRDTDSYLINTMCENGSIDEIPALIRLKGFKINDNIISELITSLSINNERDPREIEMICTAIEEKATSPKEYRKAKKYTKVIKQSLDHDSLKEKRQELLECLATFNDYLQETVPGKTKIKNINQKNSK